MTPRSAPGDRSVTPIHPGFDANLSNAISAGNGQNQTDIPDFRPCPLGPTPICLIRGGVPCRSAHDEIAAGACHVDSAVATHRVRNDLCVVSGGVIRRRQARTGCLLRAFACVPIGVDVVEPHRLAHLCVSRRQVRRTLRTVLQMDHSQYRQRQLATARSVSLRHLGTRVDPSGFGEVHHVHFYRVGAETSRRGAQQETRMTIGSDLSIAPDVPCARLQP